jgi:hypothetical protein
LQEEPDHLQDRLYIGVAAGAVMLYGMLAVSYPLVWAILTAITLLLLFGVFTGKFIFQIRDWRTLALMTPLFGAGWLAFLWLVLKVVG